MSHRWDVFSTLNNIVSRSQVNGSHDTDLLSPQPHVNRLRLLFVRDASNSTWHNIMTSAIIGTILESLSTSPPPNHSSKLYIGRPAAIWTNSERHINDYNYFLICDNRCSWRAFALLRCQADGSTWHGWWWWRTSFFIGKQWVWGALSLLINYIALRVKSITNKRRVGWSAWWVLEDSLEAQGWIVVRRGVSAPHRSREWPFTNNQWQHTTELFSAMIMRCYAMTVCSVAN